MREGVTEKDLDKVMRELGNIESPDSFQLAPKVAEQVGIVIGIVKQLGGEAEFVFGNTRYKLTLAESKIRANTRPKRKLAQRPPKTGEQ